MYPGFWEIGTLQSPLFAVGNIGAYGNGPDLHGIEVVDRNGVALDGIRIALILKRGNDLAQVLRVLDKKPKLKSV